MAKTFRVGVMAMVVGLGGVSFGAETMPRAVGTPPPAAAGVASAADYSEPKKTVESFLAAMQSGDEGAARAALVISPESKATVDLYLKLIFATTKLQKAALKQFGAAADKYFGASAETMLETRMKTVADAPVKISGDSAVMTIPPSQAVEGSKTAGGTIVFTKIGREWKLDGASLFSLTTMSPEDRERQRALAEKLLPITEQVTRDVEGGKYSAAVEAFQDFWQKSLEAMKAVNHMGTMPATEPGK